MKINKLICPECGFETLTSSNYTTCAGCQTFFYASQSRNCNPKTKESVVQVETTVPPFKINYD